VASGWPYRAATPRGAQDVGLNREPSVNIGFGLTRVTEKANGQHQQLPGQTQAKVLGFVECSLAKARRQQARREG
jgi:hypothetical protein